MLAVEDLIASLLESLQAAGKLDNTYIFFTSDNGYHLGQHRLLPGKQTPYEEDIRVPLIVRGPGVREGAVVNELAGNIDLAPTFAELAGIDINPSVDGRSLAPLLTGDLPPGSAWRRAFLLGLRTTDSLYVEYATGEKELYDLGSDPYELQNLASTADPSRLAQLSSWLSGLRPCAASSCREQEEAGPQAAVAAAAASRGEPLAHSGPATR